MRRDGATVELLSGEELLASAAPAHFDLAVPNPPSRAEAASAQAALPPRTGHPFPECFGCGPARVPGDAAAVFVGPLPDRRGRGAGDGVGCAGLPVVPAAAPGSDAPWLLGTLTVSQERPVGLDTDHVLLAWRIGREGRKAITASAVVGPDGQVCARARAIWLEVRASTG